MEFLDKDFEEIHKKALENYTPSDEGVDIKDEVKFWYHDGNLYGLDESYTHEDWVYDCIPEIADEISDYIETHKVEEHDAMAMADAAITVACKHDYIRINRMYSDVIAVIYDFNNFKDLKNAVLDFPEIFETKWSKDIKVCNCLDNKYKTFHSIQDLLNY